MENIEKKNELLSKNQHKINSLKYLIYLEKRKISYKKYYNSSKGRKKHRESMSKALYIKYWRKKGIIPVDFNMDRKLRTKKNKLLVINQNVE